jgi:hypothetical protein
MKISWITLGWVWLFSILVSCKKTTIKRYIYCTKNCKEFSARVLDIKTHNPIEGLTILISEDNSTHGFLSYTSYHNLGYFKTNEQGIFNAKISTTNFNAHPLVLAVYTHDTFPSKKIATLTNYPDTLTDYYY